MINSLVDELKYYNDLQAYIPYKICRQHDFWNYNQFNLAQNYESQLNPALEAAIGALYVHHG